MVFIDAKVQKDFQMKLTDGLKSYPSQCVLYHSRKCVLLHHKYIRGLAFNCKPVGLTVVAHRTHKVLKLRQQVGQLKVQQNTTRHEEKISFFTPAYLLISINERCKQYNQQQT